MQDNFVTKYISILQTVVSDPGLPLLGLGDRVDCGDPAVLVVYRPLPVLGQLLPAGSPELAERAVVGCLLHLYRGASLIILKQNICLSLTFLSRITNRC